MCVSGSRTSSSYLQMQHLAGQHRVPVIHEAQVAAIVAAQILEVVAEGLTFGEVLLVGAEARIHRMAAHVDDGRVRQHRVDEADVAEVVGHLVDEVRPPGAQRRGLLDVAPAEQSRIARGQRREHSPGTRRAPDSRGRTRGRWSACSAARRCLRLCEWLARICSTRVEPERGNPTMKIGAGSSYPAPARSAKNARVEAAPARAASCSRTSSMSKGTVLRRRRVAGRIVRRMPRRSLSCARSARRARSAAAPGRRRRRRRP